MDKAYDVVGLGCIAVDDILYVDAYPPPDAKTRVLERERDCGGLTATALAAAARLGSRCAYAGALGDDEASRFAIEALRVAGVDVSTVVRLEGAAPVRSTIVVDPRRGTRNIFYDLSGCVGPVPERIDEALIASARVLLVDHFGTEGMAAAAAFARRRGIPVVADFEDGSGPAFRELIDRVDHLILSEGFATAWSGAATAAGAARALWRPDRALVAVTLGECGVIYFDGKSSEPVPLPAFAVEAVDTTGCGDVFHGAYCHALARGLALRERLRFAAAAAAIKATRRGGQAGAPERWAVEALLAAGK
jgi:sugar/nucleoside kinase (ribokinase family)